ncbi:hypothetical protein [Paucidesulfovibrio longus]|uniref:hypothetical protein n=1 Tax=Paucidesulfovibrio longus TaxID=889 RepID=UPI0003B4C608|nr:hypothetical protein [Paucidesulfovibrio longus]
MSLTELNPNWLPPEADNPDLQPAWYYWRSFQGVAAYTLEEQQELNRKRFADIDKESRLFYYMLGALTQYVSLRLLEAGELHDAMEINTKVIDARFKLADVPVLGAAGPKLLSILDSRSVSAECRKASDEFAQLCRQLVAKAQSMPAPSAAATSPAAPGNGPATGARRQVRQSATPYPESQASPAAPRRTPGKRWWEFWK